MRRLLSTSLLALALIVGAAPVAHAAPCVQGADLNDPYCENTAAAVQDLNTAAQSSTNPAAAATPTTLPSNPDVGEGFGKIMTWIMSLFAWLVGVAAITLDNAVYYTVVTMGNYVHNLTAVGVTWRILRDIGNIMLIFGFLAVGITTVLNVDWYGGGKKMLPMMLVAAVFLNFSLFISEAIIDTGNLFATQFYQQINGGNPAGAQNFDLASVSREGISNKIMAQLGLQNIYDVRTNTAVFKAGNSWVIGFLGIILFLITAFVMFSLAFVLIARFVILLFLIILSPVAFAGLAVPQLARRAGQWWAKLFEQTVTAPILLLMLYIALAIITDAKFLTGFGVDSSTGGWTGFVANATGTANLPGFASLILSFLVAMGLLLAVVIQSKNLSAFGAEKASALAGKLTFGLTAAGMRTTAGWGFNSAAQRFRSSKLARVPVVGRSIAGVLDKGAKASFDVRGATIGGGLKAAGINAGKPQVGGYRKELEEAIKGREEHAKLLTGRSATRQETESLKTAADNKKKAEEEKTAAEAERTTASVAAVQQRMEVARLEAINKSNRDKGIFDQKNTNDLKAAREKLLASETGIAAAEQKIKKADEEIAKRTSEEAKTKATIQGATSAKAAQEEYARNLQIMPWGILTRNSKAAENIIKNAGKSAEARQVDALMDLLKKNAAPAAAPAAPATPKP